MVTLWIPLQDGAGLTSPGLEWSDIPIHYFSWKHGDGSSQALIDLDLRAESYEQNSIHSVSVERGSVLAFNGLTCHRTMLSKRMTRHRDALLIRFINTESKPFFPGSRDKDFSLELISK